MEPKSRQQDLDTLEHDLGNLQVEFARFFAGDRDRPPFELRDDLTAHVRLLGARQHASTAERFRLGSLTARFRSFNELSDRRLRQQQRRSLPKVGPADGVIAGSERGTRAVRRLFFELYKGHETPASMPSFEEFLERKVSEFRSRTGCSSVQFRVIEQDGKRSLRARPLDGKKVRSK